jgi:dihydropyrimidinase/allantoinase
MNRFDTVVLNGTVVVPEVGPIPMDLGIRDGYIAAMADKLAAADGAEVVDARGLYVLPGAIDSHFHVGIYRPLDEDARSESRSAISGGVTTIISYFRTGHHYLNKVGPYREILPEVLSLSESNFFCDYAYHIAPMTTAQLDEIDWLVDQGISSFKFYMFYKGLTLSADSTQGRQYVMSDDYDLGHLHDLMAGVADAASRRKQRISLSLHCENPEIIRAFIARVEESKLEGLEAYSKARPPLSESLSIEEAGVLARATLCPINLLHLSSREAVESAVALRRRYPELDIMLETTLHHLMLNYENLQGLTAKVNPPIRTRNDCAAIWGAVTAGEIDTVVSDHACCLEELKQGGLWSALPGFGGTSLLYPILLSEGVKRHGLSLTRAAALASTNPARNFGLYPKKGTIAIGTDADLVLCDMERPHTVTAGKLLSAQEYTPFEGLSVSVSPVATMLRGRVVVKKSETVSTPAGKFVPRPVTVDNARDGSALRLVAANGEQRKSQLARR